MQDLDSIIEEAKQNPVPYGYQCDIIMVTPEIAEKLIKFNTKNRSVKKNTVRFYSKQMNGGKWIFNGEPIQFNVNQVMSNGQHRLMAQIEAQETLPLLIVRNIPEDAYKTIDQQHTRSLGDMFEMEGIVGHTLKAAIITKYCLWSAKDGNNRDIKQSLRKSDITMEEAFKMYMDNADFFDMIHDKALKYYSKLPYLVQSEYGGFMSYLIMHKKHPEEKVFDFFDQFSGIKASNKAITKLRDEFHKYKHKLNIKLTPTQIYFAVACTWEGYLKGFVPKKIIFQPKEEKTPQFI